MGACDEVEIYGGGFFYEPADLTPQARAAKAMWLLMQAQQMSTAELAEATGITGAGVRALMDNISIAGVPVYKPSHGYWALLRDDHGDIGRGRGIDQFGF